MTRKDLSQVYFLHKELKMWERKLNDLRSKSLVGSKKIDGMPYANTNAISDPTYENAKAVLELMETVDIFRTNLERKILEVDRFIMTLDDSQLRQIIEYRCCKLMSWNDVAAMIGGDNTGDTVRMIYNRAFPKEQNTR